jgi:small subunit ribosomal protein S27e
MAGNFYTVRCPDCENEQVVFGKAATAVACAVCGTTLARPAGGNAEFEGQVVDTIERREATEEIAGEAE